VFFIIEIVTEIHVYGYIYINIFCSPLLVRARDTAYVFKIISVFVSTCELFDAKHELDLTHFSGLSMDFDNSSLNIKIRMFAFPY